MAGQYYNENELWMERIYFQNDAEYAFENQTKTLIHPCKNSIANIVYDEVVFYWNKGRLWYVLTSER